MNTIIILAIVNTLWRLGFLIWLYSLSSNKVTLFVMDTLKALVYGLICFIPLILIMVSSPTDWINGLAISLFLNLIYYWRLIKEAY